MLTPANCRYCVAFNHGSYDFALEYYQDGDLMQPTPAPTPTLTLELTPVPTPASALVAAPSFYSAERDEHKGPCVLDCHHHLEQGHTLGSKGGSPATSPASTNAVANPGNKLHTLPRRPYPGRSPDGVSRAILFAAPFMEL
jgi:hypothetical protein